MSVTTYLLTGLHCQACVRRVSQALSVHAREVQVTLSPMQAVLTDAHAPLPQLQAAVRSSGKYELLFDENLDQKQHIGVIESAQSATKSIVTEQQTSFLQTYRPLLLIIAYILAGSLLIQIGQHTGHGMSTAASISVHETMRYFMAGFFLTFSFFKLLDIAAFAKAYAGYDLLAARWQGWGYLYPFVELTLGLAYLANFSPQFTNWATLIIMGFSAIGVIRAVTSKQTIQCACLGTIFKLPMSTVTIVEDVGMVVMAAAMLITQS
ncbi:heavy metal-associated domain-containing protein [Variovorax sp. PCZ-1]|uniref:heavy-metal-associated domain-containing protein n=1 Tax=Variovorax sp. PCZ-1 TaxID=2835533 RepID=UPI001BD008F8|nr:heavy metal-associated domain-containing protein [Variovorax sp. PCZ-1]MBS7806369.1 heavy-metal-associated domain-containing protein [Variovorax sp. PCZ-1]